MVAFLHNKGSLHGASDERVAAKHGRRRIYNVTLRLI
jgi:hypothetical protein